MRFSQASSNRDPDPNELELDDMRRPSALSPRVSPSDASNDDVENGDWAELTADVPWDAELSHEILNFSQLVHNGFDLVWIGALTCFPSTAPPTGFFLDRFLLTVLFFVLAWWLRISQAIYDTRFLLDDTWHRIFSVCRLGLFYAVAVMFVDHFKGLSTDEDLYIISPASDAGLQTAFAGLAGVFFTSRLLQAVQYYRVLYILKRERCEVGEQPHLLYPQPRDLWMMVLMLMNSALVFLVICISHVFGTGVNGLVWSALQLLVCAVAISGEIAAYLMAFFPSHSQERMLDRLQFLTSGIFVHGFGLTLNYARILMPDLGLSRWLLVAFQVGPIAASYLLMWRIYRKSFAGFTAIGTTRQKLVLLYHFLVHLLIVILMAATRSTLKDAWHLMKWSQCFTFKELATFPDVQDTVRWIASPAVWIIPLTALYLIMMAGLMWLSGPSNSFSSWAVVKARYAGGRCIAAMLCLHIIPGPFAVMSMMQLEFVPILAFLAIQHSRDVPVEKPMIHGQPSHRSLYGWLEKDHQRDEDSESAPGNDPAEGAGDPDEGDTSLT
ncbi:hypothetical protein EXIGLDRAFT_830105 [Exidia glandulosa HHB12029]|uniref:Transmembrane protein n=1 Tax=Exidia glandulosa HHB12029 TaxID=1314781 RepID=A0A165NY90_EXIGL|nr:hypothetical protein EXIGLDRAFT_830105 [Exidia glandulosa HHB12029]